MKSKETEDTLVECLNYSAVGSLPNKLDATTAHWALAIALVERTSLGEDYVIVKNYRGKPYTLRTFNKLNFPIKKIKEIYPYLLYEDSFLPQMNTLEDIEKYLDGYYSPNELRESDGKLSKEKINGLLIERSIKETYEMMDRNPRYMPKPLKVEVVEEKEDNKEEKTETTEIETKENINETEETEPTKETEPKRKSGRPSKKNKGK